MRSRTWLAIAMAMTAVLGACRTYAAGDEGPGKTEVAAAGPREAGRPVGLARPAVEIGGAGLRFRATGLTLIRPYARGRVPVVFVHGFGGSPLQWHRMIRALEADPAIGERYQYWTFGYSTVASIPYSAHLLREALGEARRRLDPGGRDAALDRMVVVGHSMGGLLAKMLVQDSGTRLWDLYAARPPDRLAGPPEARDLFRKVLVFEPMAEVRRVVLIATPHRGVRLDLAPIHRVGSGLLRSFDEFRLAHEALLESNGPESFTPMSRSAPPAGVGQLTWDHPLLAELGRLELAAGAAVHSIVADRRDPPRPGGGDGIVPYESAHMPDPIPETLVAAGHLCLDSPRVIEVVGRILADGRGD
jgi:pimeloyl-ACP methyl ester carboxylesterase